MRPLSAGAFAQWIDFISRKGGGNQGENIASLLSDGEYGELCQSVLTAHCIEVQGLEVEDEAGVRAGTITDVLGHALTFGLLQRALGAYLNANTLNETDVGNSNGR